MNNTEFINLIHSLNNDFKKFIRKIYDSNLKMETNVVDVLNHIDPNIKINSILDIDFLFNSIDSKIILSDNNFYAFLNYCDFLYKITIKISINNHFINKYWDFKTEAEKKVFISYCPSILDVKTFYNKNLDDTKKAIINKIKDITYLSPYYDGEKIIRLSQYLSFIK